MSITISTVCQDARNAVDKRTASGVRRYGSLGVATYELVEAYPDDKYLPSYLILARHGLQAFHVLFATDAERDNVRVVTSYHPDPAEWRVDLKTRPKS
jgi:hypothetical protein